MARCWGVGILDNNSFDTCVENKGYGRTACQLQTGICTDQINIKLQVINDKFYKDKQECYQRYK